MSESELSVATITKQNLIEAFCQLAAQQPANKISIKALTATAGYDRTTFYQYFDNLADLTSAVQEQFLTFVKIRRATITLDSPDFVTTFIAIYQEHPSYFEALLGPYADNNFIDQLTTRLNLDFFESTLADNSQLKPYLANFHFTMVLTTFHLWLSRDKDLSLPELIKLIKQLYTQGMTAFEPTE